MHERRTYYGYPEAITALGIVSSGISVCERRWTMKAALILTQTSAAREGLDSSAVIRPVCGLLARTTT
jgi:hypothetical protein